MTWATHRVINQVPALGEVNLYETDFALQEVVARVSGDVHHARLHDYGQRISDTHVWRQAELANQHPPVLRAWDPQGHRIDHVEFHPSWHELLKLGFLHGLHCSGWSGKSHAHVGRAAHYLLHGQVEAGTLCPMTMTSAAIPLLEADARFHQFVEKINSSDYDQQDLPWTQKTSLMVGMGLTEKQGGSDLRGTHTRATRAGDTTEALAGIATDEHYLITGHKWFFSSPTSDAHLVLATHDDVLSCFFVPRWLGEGQRNGVLIQRLKDKVGNRSNASAEVEFQDARGIMVGEPGRGIAQLVRMASYTRLDCILGSSALLRQAVVQAIHHARHRRAFGKALIEQPLMKAVLCDLALESEAATVLAVSLAAAFDESSQLAQAYRRILTPAAKFWVCKRAVVAIAECMEAMGGNGYVEPSPLARLYREAPVNAIWEGSGNVMCLDVLRAQSRQPELMDALLDDLSAGSHHDKILQESMVQLKGMLNQDDYTRQANARKLSSLLVLLVQAVILRRLGPGHVADDFIATRFTGHHGVIGNVIPEGAVDRLLSRAWAQ